MTDQQEKSIACLNKLIEICKDGNKGYKDAADHIDNDELKTILYRFSQQRALFEAELEGEVRNLGGHPESTSTALGGVHRAWIDLKAAFQSKDHENILEECKRGDKAAVQVYEEALKAPIPDFIKEKVKEQFTLIKGAIMQLDEFEESLDED